MSAGVDAYRLTPADETAITARVRETVTGWKCQSGAGWVFGSVERATLRRVGMAAIGCGSADLRDVELDWIAGEVVRVAAEVLGLSVEVSR